ncbi:EamA family transporter [Actinomadura yumaensis]|uniref:EamA family transporter n=1 Tax=Actinomadura yumaensis TaxID=111807 RepID=UPI00361E0338
MERIDPRLLAVLGAAFISVSAIFVSLSGAAAGTAAFFRCALALPVLLPLALLERRRTAPRRRTGADLLAGALLGGDLVLWGASIAAVGAGVATVLVNVQVVVLPLLALAATGSGPRGASRSRSPSCSAASRSRAASPTPARAARTRCAASRTGRARACCTPGTCS